MTSRLVAVPFAVLLLAGCYRTEYQHLRPPAPAPAELEPAAAVTVPGGTWRHFFLFGWIPDEKVIDAAAACGGAEHVDEIRTQQTFVQGLVEAVASFYVNIYSPWNSEIVCSGQRRD